MRQRYYIGSYLSMLACSLLGGEHYLTISASQGRREVRGDWSIAPLIDAVFGEDHYRGAYFKWTKIRPAVR